MGRAKIAVALLHFVSNPVKSSAGYGGKGRELNVIELGKRKSVNDCENVTFSFTFK